MRAPAMHPLTRPWAVAVPEMTKAQKVEALEQELKELQDRHLEVVNALVALERSAA